MDSVALVASTSAEQFALIGGVFLILGGAFVFAPQIISAVNGFFARLFGRPVKARAPQPTEAAAQPPPAKLSLDPHEAPADAESEWAPPPEAEPEPGQAVSRLRDEISSAWGRKAEP